MKLQTKITLLFFAISTVGLLLMNAAIFYFVSEFNFEDFFKRLEARVRFAAQIKIHPDGRTAVYKDAKTRLDPLIGERDFVIKMNVDSSFKKPINLPPEFYNTLLSGRKARHTYKNHFYSGELFKTPYGRYIVIAEAVDPYGYKELHELRKILIVIFVISLVLSYIIGRIFSHYTIKPIRALIRSVKNISATNLHMRVEAAKGKDEIAELVSTFNNMLNRLETAFETQNNFVSNASHELRTPLSIISGETELLLAKKGLDPESIANVKAIFNEAEKLENILTSLLGLAQSGFDGKKQNWQLIRLDELIITVADSVKKIAPRCMIDIDFSALPEDECQLQTEGNVNLLHLALSNIVLNACKYSSNQPVSVKISSSEGAIKIIVIDKGIGIPIKEQQHIFEPFFRASNTGQFAGHGIGLPLTLNIIKLHRGTINIISEEQQGTEMQILLPVAE
ncbi:HAMP domain-containing histidine kinase [Mucilaginibacter sp. JRF]|uniref:HAMP domain-containing sensor histidine kinase n=1 Tax=Mucilaginibacter sp. JRF TaxID=2780088 RepID=UPI00187EEE3D|nr:HAMP domain-containing sensor histidine kinase [Mucilaginibacter sp. JRF]MBE9586502.1 HAMP domain-containing histidine kinase [Mucilaginibacter sp. JRF]